MPKEFRKRGKKNKKGADKDGWKPQKDDRKPREDSISVEEPGPSWIIPASKDADEVNLEAPFGYLDADVKAYFRTVDVQIRNWQDNEADARETGNTDPNAEQRLFFMAALTEMSGKEKQLATDPDCSSVLERMAHSMDDFARRVFVDRLAGSYETLVKHRFASHVCQTLFTVATDTVSREENGILPTLDSFEEGELRTLTDLILAICQELSASFTSLIMDPFASHVIRALLLLLSPSLQSPDKMMPKSNSTVRSKKSEAWKSRQAPMKDVFAANKGKSSDTHAKSAPKSFGKAAAKFVHILREELNANEVRALAANKVASPVLQMLLEVEGDQEMSDAPDSLMDRVLVGIITSYNEDPSVIPDQSDYLSTLFRDPTSSHLLETLVTRAPDRAFAILWVTYFQGKLVRVSTHPIANFVVARAMEKVDGTQLGEACEELKNAWGKIIKSSRSGVLRAMIDRAATLRTHEQDICEAICVAFDLATIEDRRLVVPCVMTLKPLQQYQSTMISAQSQTQDSHDSDVKRKGPRDGMVDSMEPKVPGAIILQSLLQLNEPHNQLVTDSIKTLPMEDLLKLAHHPTGSRVLDAILESPTVPFKAKRNFVMSFIGHYHILVDDRIGSRVGDRCWAFADPYLREKIARSLFPQEAFLAGSFYGKFFARNLNLYLLQRKPEDWKTLQSQNKLSSQPTKLNPAPPYITPPLSVTFTQEHSKKRKRNTRPENEIDALFDASFGKKVKKGVLDPKETFTAAGGHGHSVSKRAAISPPTGDQDLSNILGAIRAAPKDLKGGHGKKNMAR